MRWLTEALVNLDPEDREILYGGDISYCIVGRYHAPSEAKLVAAYVVLNSYIKLGEFRNKRGANKIITDVYHQFLESLDVKEYEPNDDSDDDENGGDSNTDEAPWPEGKSEVSVDELSPAAWCLSFANLARNLSYDVAELGFNEQAKRYQNLVEKYQVLGEIESV